MPTTLLHVILDDGLPAVEAVLFAKTIEYPLRRMALLPGNRLIVLKNVIYNAREWVQLRSLRQLTAPISRRHGVRQHFLYSISGNTKPTGRLSLAQPINMARKPDSSIKLHGVHGLVPVKWRVPSVKV